MRVVAGSARGTQLTAPQGRDVRPTTDMVKEAVFGSLQFDIAGARVLDMFSGSGALGIEALSRGAEVCVFVDSDAAAAELTKQNLERTRLAARAQVIKQDFELACAQLAGQMFDFIFADPPYAAGLYAAAARAIIGCGLLAPGGRFICESDEKLTLDGFRAAKCKRYGKTYITFFERTV